MRCNSLPSRVRRDTATIEPRELPLCQEEHTLLLTSSDDAIQTITFTKQLDNPVYFTYHIVQATYTSLNLVMLSNMMMSELVPPWLVMVVTEIRKSSSSSNNINIIFLGLIVATISFIVGFIVGSITILDRLLGKFVNNTSSSSSWWNLYSTIVMSYITIRSYQLFIEPSQQQLANILYGRKKEDVIMTNHNKNRNITVGDNDNDNDYDSDMVLLSRRKSDWTSKEIQENFQMFNRIDEWGESVEDDTADWVEEEKKSNDDDAVSSLVGKDTTTTNTPMRRRKQGGSNTASLPQHHHQQQQQPIDMSGVYQLISNDNFDSFLMAQGVPWVLARAADNARPIHRITHIGQQITIKIEGIIESSSTYTINGPPVETLIRGRLFADQVTYLTVREMGLLPTPNRDDYDVDSNIVNDNDNDNVGGGGGDCHDDYCDDGRISPTSSSRRLSSNMQLPLEGWTQELGTTTSPGSPHRRTRSLDTDAADLQQAILASSLNWMMAPSTTTSIGSATMVIDDLMSEVWLKSTFGDIERATTDFRKSFDDMIVKPLNDTIDGIATSAAAAIPVIELAGSNSTWDSTTKTIPTDDVPSSQQQRQQESRVTGSTGTASTLIPATHTTPMERLEVTIENGHDENNDRTAFSSSSSTMPNTPQGQHTFKTIIVDENNDEGNGHYRPTNPATTMAVVPRPSVPAVKNPNGTTTTSTQHRGRHDDEDVVYCGIKTTKRAVNDGNTVTVFRHLLNGGSKIIMTSRVVFDDPTNEPVEAIQIFERIRE